MYVMKDHNIHNLKLNIFFIQLSHFQLKFLNF